MMKCVILTSIKSSVHALLCMYCFVATLHLVDRLVDFAVMINIVLRLFTDSYGGPEGLFLFNPRIYSVE